MDRATRRAAQRRRKTKPSNGAKDGKDGDYDTHGNSSIMRSPPPRSRSLLQQDKEQGDGTAMSDSESEDDTDSDKETSYHTLLQSLNSNLEDAENEIKKNEKNPQDDTNIEMLIEFKERMIELRKKVQMIEDGTFSEYCRRCVDFKDDRSRSLETAKQHKELQLKNIQDLRLFDLQRAENLYMTSKFDLKQKLISQLEEMLMNVQNDMDSLDQNTTESINTSTSIEKDSSHVSSNTDIIEETDDIDTEPKLKRPKLDFSTLDMSGPFLDIVKSKQKIKKSLNVPFYSLGINEIQNDLKSICLTWKKNEIRNDSIETISVHYNHGVLWCGKYIFDEGDEVVISSNVMTKEYIGIIHSFTEKAVYFRLNTGEITRVYYTLIETKRCEIKPILRGNSGLKNLQSSGWVRCEPF